MIQVWICAVDAEGVPPEMRIASAKGRTPQTPLIHQFVRMKQTQVCRIRWQSHLSRERTIC